jgi:hypothetical protein
MATYTCCVCGDRFEPEPHNKHHQRYCGKPGCQAERQRRKRLKHYHRRQNDLAFRLSEAERQRQLRLNKKMVAMGELDTAAVAPATPGVAVPPPMPAAQPSLFDFPIVDLVVGVVSQVSACVASTELRRVCMRLAEEGRRFLIMDRPGQSPTGHLYGHSPSPPR